MWQLVSRALTRLQKRVGTTHEAGRQRREASGDAATDEWRRNLYAVPAWVEELRGVLLRNGFEESLSNLPELVLDIRYAYTRDVIIDIIREKGHWWITVRPPEVPDWGWGVHLWLSCIDKTEIPIELPDLAVLAQTLQSRLDEVVDYVLRTPESTRCVAAAARRRANVRRGLPMDED